VRYTLTAKRFPNGSYAGSGRSSIRIWPSRRITFPRWSFDLEPLRMQILVRGTFVIIAVSVWLRHR
jgi:hypothetical protein